MLYNLAVERYFYVYICNLLEHSTVVVCEIVKLNVIIFAICFEGEVGDIMEVSCTSYLHLCVVASNILQFYMSSEHVGNIGLSQSGLSSTRSKDGINMFHHKTINSRSIAIRVANPNINKNDVENYCGYHTVPHHHFPKLQQHR